VSALRRGPAVPRSGLGGRPRQYCGAACRKAGQRLRAALGGDWWQHQPWYPAWAAAEERERQEQKDRADAGRRELGRRAEAIRQQAGEKRRKADEDRNLLKSMPPQVRAGVEAARRAEGERVRRQFALLALRMDLELLSERHARILAETGQRFQLTGQASRMEKLLWAAALAPDDAAAQALFAKARELAAKTLASGRTRPSAPRACSGRSSRPPRPARYGAWPGTAAPGGQAGTGAGVFSRSASARRCSPVSGGAASISSRTQESRSVPGSCAGCPSWSWYSPRRLSAAGLELADPGRVPGRLAAAVLVSRCGADPLARMN
jgi:hypothetical protein